MIEIINMRPPGTLLTGLREFICAAVPLNGTVVEIGSYAGASAREFLKIASHITCVDPWKEYKEFNVAGDLVGGISATLITNAEQLFDDFVKEHAGHVTKIKAPSLVGCQQIPNASADVVYIDGDHTYEAVCADIRAWTAKVKPGGVLSGHDYGVPQWGVTQAVNHVLGLPHMVFQDGSWLVRNAA